MSATQQQETKSAAATRKRKMSLPGPEDCIEAETASKLTCPICLCVAKDVWKTSCGHVFCKECIDDALAEKKRCPVCRKENPVLGPDRILSDIAQGLRIRCPDGSPGLSIKDLVLKHKNEREDPCPGCLRVFDMATLETHFGYCEGITRASASLKTGEQVNWWDRSHDMWETYGFDPLELILDLDRLPKSGYIRFSADGDRLRVTVIDKSQPTWTGFFVLWAHENTGEEFSEWDPSFIRLTEFNPIDCEEAPSAFIDARALTAAVLLKKWKKFSVSAHLFNVKLEKRSS